MEFGASKVRMQKAGSIGARPSRSRNGEMSGARGDVAMQSVTSSERADNAASHPLAQLLACPPAVANLLNASAQCIEFDTGHTIFRQSTECRGLYVVISGQLLRKAERLETRLTLGSVRAGDLVELAAALGDGHHTYTLTSQSAGSVLLLPIEALGRAFQAYPPLRMQLLEELAREVSRAYGTCCATRMAGIRHRGV
jgi:CRP-like cAMP-binding protein